MPPKRAPAQSKPPTSSSEPSTPRPATTAPAFPPLRLDSLSRPRASAPAAPPMGGAGGLKFKPKLVPRRPKEERDASAPSPVAPSPVAARGRGRGRGGSASGSTGRGRFEPVSSVAAGPFANPTFGDSRTARAASFEKRPVTGASASNSVLREAAKLSGPASHGDEIDDAGSDEDALRDGVERINIAKAAKMSTLENSDFRYFPIRDEISGDGVQTGASVAEEMIDEAAVLEREANEFVDVFGSDGISSLERNLFFFQFAPVLPKFENAEYVKTEQVKSEPLAQPRIKTEVQVEQGQAGLVGHLYVHRSGKVSIRWGGAEMEVAKAAETEFLQDVVVLDPGESKATLLGQIAKKVVVSPNIDLLFGDEIDSD